MRWRPGNQSVANSHLATTMAPASKSPKLSYTHIGEKFSNSGSGYVCSFSSSSIFQAMYLISETLLAPIYSALCMISSTHSLAPVGSNDASSASVPADWPVAPRPKCEKASSALRSKSAINRTAVLKETRMMSVSLVTSVLASESDCDRKVSK